MREDEGSVSITVSMLPGTLGRDVIVSLKTMNGTAIGTSAKILQEFHIQLRTFFLSLNTAGMDFPNTSLHLTFSPSSPTQTVMVPILNDAVTEDMLEYFSLVLMSTDSAVSLNPMIANITILDDNDSKYCHADVHSKHACMHRSVYCGLDCSLLTCSDYNWTQHSSLFCA